MKEKTATEQGINVSAKNDESRIDDVLTIVEASQLKLSDEFLKYDPNYDDGSFRRSKILKKSIKEKLEDMIDRGLDDFYIPRFTPSFKGTDKELCFLPGTRPAVGASYNEWEKLAKDFCPARNSRLGTYEEYVAFIGVLIKRLVRSGRSVEKAWYEVCADSKNLGNYVQKKITGNEHFLESTKRREVCGFYDLANTSKILAWNKAGYYKVASGDYYCISNLHPIAHSYREKNRELKDYYSVGWMVFD